jgi:serine/arginine repetitive matrix protein 2
LDLDRTRHGEYLMRRSSKSVLKSYLDSFGFVGIRVDIALRVFLLSTHIPLPASHQGNNGLEYFLDAFASRWYEANAKLVDYDKDCAHRLVRAIVQLNELLHDGIAQEPGTKGQPQREVTSGDFIEAFRRYDPRYLVTDRLLEEVYLSISEERLSTARSSGNGNDAQIIMKRAIPPRLTWKVQSEPIIFRLPHVDPNFSIRLYGQDLIFDPPVLNFAKSPEASFRVMGQSLGSKSMILCRSGPNATKYTGLPSSSSIVVERAFMRHTFQIAFQNHRGVKRRYMFSVDDSLLRHQWVSYLKQHITNANDLLASTSSTTSKFRQAAESIAFRVLQDTLIGSPYALNPSKFKDRRYPNGNSIHISEGYRFAPDRAAPTSNYHNGSHLAPFHARSKSRSKVYHRHGAGKNELDVSTQTYRDSIENDVEGRSESEQDGSPRSDGTLWSARDLELHCKHNSAIVSILFTYLQDGEQERGIS